jgi:quercetin dioxygenase-like cupin family protein
MAIPHARSGQIVDILAADGNLPSAKSFALFKSAQLEVMRVVLPAGKAFPPHRVAGEITVQCLEGRIDLSVDGASQALRPGQLLHLEGGVLHGLTGLEDSSALVTIILCRP